MRLAPVSIRWSHDPAAVIEQAAASSRPTHPASRPVDACKVLAAMTAALIRGEPREAVLSAEFWQAGTLHPAVEAVALATLKDQQSSTTTTIWPFSTRSFRARPPPGPPP